MSQEKQLTIDQAHRHFGVEFNNKIFRLAAQETLNEQEKEEIVACAHASLLHWQSTSIWKEVNTQRALYMLAKAYIAIEDRVKSQEYAIKCFEYTMLHEEKMQDFDVVYCHEICARASALNKHKDTYNTHIKKVNHLLPLIQNEEDKKWVQKDLESGKWFGMSLEVIK